MRKFIFFTVAAFALAGSSSTAFAGPAEDATAAVTTMLDKFNAGDIDAFVAAHRDGAIIIDEFAPYSWGGSGSVQQWLQGYARDAAARHITNGHMDYDKPIQANSDGRSAYIVLPTVYRFKQDGNPMKGPGSMTFVIVKTGEDWKISSWTYSGATPVAE